MRWLTGFPAPDCSKNQKLNVIKNIDFLFGKIYTDEFWKEIPSLK